MVTDMVTELKVVGIELTKSQIDNLMEFFELGFIPMIKDMDDIDNINYMVDMCDIYKKLTAAKEMVGDGK